jgi:hypothetical protein
MKTWFKHDFNARNDEKLVNLLMTEKLEGLAIYWCIIEMLYENNGSLDNNCERIAFALHTDKDKINRVINDYKLFKINQKEKIIFCDRVLLQLKEIDKISEKARIGAKVKWNKYYANAKRPQCPRNATAMQIDKRREDKIDKIDKIELQAEPAENLAPLIKEFEIINPTINYGNTTQRNALKEMLSKFGYEKLLATIKAAVAVQGKPYAPVITTPCQLKENMGKLLVYYKKEENNKPLII